MTCDRKTEHCRSLFQQDVSARPENGALPFTFLLFLRYLYVETKPTYNMTMAGKTKQMSQIKQLLLLKKEGVSNRKAAAIVGINKETVNNYVRKALADELGIEGLLRLDDPVLEHRLKGGNPAYADKRFGVFKELLPYLQEEMKRKHVTLKLLWEEYVEEHPDDHYSLTQFRFHYNQNTVAKKESTSTILADMRAGGEKLFLDFTGDTMGYIDVETGEMVQCQAFVATLPASDYGYLLFVPSQRTEDFVYAVTQCLKHLGGVPRMLVPDNLKAAVIKTDRYEPSLNKVLEDMGNHYGTVVVPARPVHPRDKSNVEGSVRLVYMRVFAELRNETFFSIGELNAAAAKMQKHNQKRMQKNPYTREERFLAVDRPNLIPLPPCDFEIVSYTDLKVSSNCCVYLGRDQHYYTVPYQHISKTAHVAYTRSLVKIYVDGELVATHTRDYRKGRYTIVEEHLASKSREYRGLNASKYIERAEKASTELGEVVRHIFYSSSMPAETHYRTCEGLLNLQRSSDPAIFRTACEAALKYGRYSYRFIRSLVESKCAGVTQAECPPSPPEHKNIRGREQFR